jgi:hypothetical protein
MNAESVQMGVGPADHYLESGVKLGYGGIASDQQTPPDKGDHFLQHNTELIYAGHDRVLMAELSSKQTSILRPRLPDSPVLSALLGMGFPELDEMRISELESIRGCLGHSVVRDRSFTATKTFGK